MQLFPADVFSFTNESHDFFPFFYSTRLLLHSILFRFQLIWNEYENAISNKSREFSIPVSILSYIQLNIRLD